eukprot:TRINITY_DN4327_c0_g2_i1.p1 TRINITY_DN4327_c0_g2~~TRINITY_DN4327_c0_g2_i1.p1  ORF type:complete len:142 (+),score=36.61 TRINITY_DN4327_c0_g2_i1:3-428(+)
MCISDRSFFFSSRRRHTRSCLVSWARRCVQETGTWGVLPRKQGIKCEKEALTGARRKGLGRLSTSTFVEGSTTRDQGVPALQQALVRTIFHHVRNILDEKLRFGLDCTKGPADCHPQAKTTLNKTLEGFPKKNGRKDTNQQ